MADQHEVVQIIPPHKWGGCIAVVSERRDWGVIAYVSIPHNDGQIPGQAYIRLTNGDFESLGFAACFVPQSETEAA